MPCALSSSPIVARPICPQNTLTAFRLAKTLGADGFECDVQITRDRHLVVAHDYLTDLKTGVHGNIPDMDFDDLRRLDFGKWKSPESRAKRSPPSKRFWKPRRTSGWYILS